MADRWTQEQFEDHWFAWAPPGALGISIPCDCSIPECHGWRMKVTHMPRTFALDTELLGSRHIVSDLSPITLSKGDAITISETLTLG